MGPTLEALVQDLARRRRVRARAVGVDLEDLEAEGRLGVVEAWRRYRPGLGVAFVTFAYPRIVGRMRDLLAAATVEHEGRKSVRAVLPMQSCGRGEGRVDEQAWLRVRWASLAAGLRPLEAHALASATVAGASYAEVAAETGQTRQCVLRRITRALARLRGAIAPRRLGMGDGRAREPQRPRYVQATLQVSRTVTDASRGRDGATRSQIHTARFSEVGFSNPSISLR